MTVIVATNVKRRFSGFLGSVMLEVAPTVYVSPKMSPSVRSRVWETLDDWHTTEPQGSIVMIWRAPTASVGMEIAYLGTPKRELVDIDGLLVVSRRLGIF